MKISKSFKVLFFLTLSGFIFNSCSDDDDSPRGVTVTNQDAAEIIESALKKNNGGFTTIITNLTDRLKTDEIIPNTGKASGSSTKNSIKDIDCNTTYVDDSYEYKYEGSLVISDFTGVSSFTLNCNNLGLPETIDFNATTDGGFETFRFLYKGQTTTNTEVSGLGILAQNFFLNGSYVRTGSLYFKLRDITLNSNTIFNLTNVTVNKYDELFYPLTGGTGNVTLTATSGSNTFTFESSIVFKGNGTATLIIDGETFEISFEG